MQSPKFCSNWQEVRNAIRPHLKRASSIFILVDSHTAQHCLPLWLTQVPECQEAEVLEIEPGEASKDWKVAGHLLEHLAECKADRYALLVSLGGGVVTDVGGFVASVYKRGIAAVHVPTSLMGMVDAAIGGKNGLDLGNLKNVVGTFAVPKAIIVQPEFLSSLPEIELRNGWFEMLKHGIIGDRSHFDQLSAWSAPGNELIRESMTIKWQIARKDLKESKNLRVFLNFGHTVGHAVESFHLSADSPIPHGFAVGWGMVVESIIAHHKGLLPVEDLELICKAIVPSLSKLKKISAGWNELATIIVHDKKNKEGEVRMALPQRIGEMNGLHAVAPSEMESAWLAAERLISGRE